MLAKFKAFGLRSLNKIRLMNLNKDIGLICKRNLPRLLSTADHGYERMDENNNHNYHKGYRKSQPLSTGEFQIELSNGTKYLLTGLVTAIVVERKYEIVKNVTESLSSTFASALVVQAKSPEKDDFEVLANLQSSSKADERKNELDLRRSCNFIANACEAAIPSVVQITVHEEDSYFGDEIKVAAGSGFVVSNDQKSSLLLTNAHVVTDHKTVQVETLSGKKLVGKVECVDTKLDLASVRIDDCSMTPLEFEPLKDARTGEFVVAIGYPFTLNHSVTAGIISSLTFSGQHLVPKSEINYIQTDCSFNQGNSGGPLLALNGKVLGVNTLKVAGSGMNLALPSDYAIKFVLVAKQFSANQKANKDPAISEKTFGAKMLPMTPANLKQCRENGVKLDGVKSGLLLYEVMSGSIAAKFGLKPGDVLIELNGRKVPDVGDFFRTINENRSPSLLIVRENQKIKINIKY